MSFKIKSQAEVNSENLERVFSKGVSLNTELEKGRKAYPVGFINTYGEQKQGDGTWKYVGKGEKTSIETKSDKDSEVSIKEDASNRMIDKNIKTGVDKLKSIATGLTIGKIEVRASKDNAREVVFEATTSKGNIIRSIGKQKEDGSFIQGAVNLFKKNDDGDLKRAASTYGFGKEMKGDSNIKFHNKFKQSLKDIDKSPNFPSLKEIQSAEDIFFKELKETHKIDMKESSSSKTSPAADYKTGYSSTLRFSFNADRTGDSYTVEYDMMSRDIIARFTGRVSNMSDDTMNKEKQIKLGPNEKISDKMSSIMKDTKLWNDLSNEIKIKQSNYTQRYRDSVKGGGSLE